MEQDDANEWACPICMEALSSLPLGTQVEILCLEGHATCSTCIIRYVQQASREAANPGVLPLRCAMPACQSELPYDECLRILEGYPMDHNRLQRYFILKEFFYGSTVFCAHTDCGEPFDVIEPAPSGANDSSLVDTVTCPACRRDTCPRCCRTAHPEHRECSCARTDEERQNDMLFLAYARKNKIAICPNPKCNAGIERTEGCNSMKCSRCASAFCFRCEMPKGRKSCKCTLFQPKTSSLISDRKAVDLGLIKCNMNPESAVNAESSKISPTLTSSPQATLSPRRTAALSLLSWYNFKFRRCDSKL